MIDPRTFYIVSASAHFFFATTVMFLCAFLGAHQPWVPYFGLLTFAAVKEGIIDPFTETPVVRWNGWLDFALYFAGGTAALAVILIR